VRKREEEGGREGERESARAHLPPTIPQPRPLYRPPSSRTHLLRRCVAPSPDSRTVHPQKISSAPSARRAGRARASATSRPAPTLAHRREPTPPKRRGKPNTVKVGAAGCAGDAEATSTAPRAKWPSRQPRDRGEDAGPGHRAHAPSVPSVSITSKDDRLASDRRIAGRMGTRAGATQAAQPCARAPRPALTPCPRPSHTSTASQTLHVV